MNCTKNPKKVLGMNIAGDHDWHPMHIDKFMTANNVYRLTEYCSLCGLNRETLKYHYQLIKTGFTEIQISKAGFHHKIYHSNLSDDKQTENETSNQPGADILAKEV